MSSKLKSVRAGHRSSVTKLFKKLNVEETEELDIEEARSVISMIKNKQAILADLDGQILNETSKEDIANEIEEADGYVLEIESKLAKITKHINTLNCRSSSNISDLNPNASEFIQQNQRPYQHHTSLSSSASSNSGSYHKLPKLSLPTFDGNLVNWQSFWNSFRCAVHDNEFLSDVQKFNYLKSQLHGEAWQSISGLQITDANYAQALNILKQRFGQQHRIINAYMQSLINLQAPSNNLHSIKLFYDTMESHIRGLESMGQYPNSYGSLLIPMIMSKLPSSVRQNMTREHGNDDWNIESIRIGLQKEICILESGNSPCTPVELLPPTAAFFTNTKPRKQLKQINKKDLTKKPCVFCKKLLAPSNCTNVDVEERIITVKNNKLCFNCLGTHRVCECKSKQNCKKCKRRHHSSLCKETNVSVCNVTEGENAEQNINFEHNAENGNAADSVSSLHSSASNISSDVLLKTAVATVQSGNCQYDANILFDEGAQRSFITQELAEKLQLKPTDKETVNISGFGENNRKVRHLDRAKIYVITDNGEHVPLTVLVVPKIAVPLRNYSRVVTGLPYLRWLKLACPLSPEDTFEISLLIGADYYWDLVQNRIVRGEGPTAIESKLGYLLSGPISSSQTDSSRNGDDAMMNVITLHAQEECDLEKFWKVESLGVTANEKNMEISDWLTQYQESSISLRDQKYYAKLPWKEGHRPLPNNYTIAKRRTEGVIRRLSKEPSLLHKYGEGISGQEKRGFIEKVDEQTAKTRNVHYIPHHPVKKDSSTTPIRIVYDCSCRNSTEEPSLNDCLLSAPPVLNEITLILLRFRLHKFAVTTDIEKAFLQIGLKEQDRDMTRFLWLSDMNNPNSELVTYRFKAVLFGATCSPFILNATILKHLKDNPCRTSEILMSDLYVDNIISSFSSEADISEYYKTARALMSKAGFNLRTWASNSSKLRELAESENIRDVDKRIKVLGLRWNVESDTLTLSTTKKLDTPSKLLTKREILSESSKIFDPLGILSPITVRCKMLMQTLWSQKMDWDETVSEDTKLRWIGICKDLKNVVGKEIPRCYFTVKSQETTDLHVFVDASKMAYGACAYVVNGDKTSFVMAKTRVAPLKNSTIPQLELMAAVVGARLASHITTSFECSRVFLWSDSQITLQWISCSKQLKVFVVNRVKEIKYLTHGFTWKYCPTKDNPADILSRGISGNQFTGNELWFNGPKWLMREEHWPQWNRTECSNVTVECGMSSSELKPESTGTINGLTTINTRQEVVDITKYSSLKTLINVTAYVLRFIHNCKNHDGKMSGVLSVQETNNAAFLWIKNVQQHEFSEIIRDLQSKSPKPHNLVHQLRLYLDESNLIRCGGRINNAPVDHDTKFPYLLPKSHKYTSLLVRDIHIMNHHCGVNSTIALIRQKYWIPAIRKSRQQRSTEVCYLLQGVK